MMLRDEKTVKIGARIIWLIAWRGVKIRPPHGVYIPFLVLLWDLNKSTRGQTHQMCLLPSTRSRQLRRCLHLGCNRFLTCMRSKICSALK